MIWGYHFFWKHPHWYAAFLTGNHHCFKDWYMWIFDKLWESFHTCGWLKIWLTTCYLQKTLMKNSIINSLAGFLKPSNSTWSTMVSLRPLRIGLWDPFLTWPWKWLTTGGDPTIITKWEPILQVWDVSKFVAVILLMAEILHHLGCIKPCK